MENKEERFNQMKQEYKEHEMSESQVLEMKKKIEQAKKENRKNQNSHVWRNIAAAAPARH